MEIFITVMTIAGAGYFGLDLFVFMSRRVKARTERRIQAQLRLYPAPKLLPPWQVIDSETGERRTYH